MSYFPVKAVSVFLWGRRVGVIAGMPGGRCAFEYDPVFRRSGLGANGVRHDYHSKMPH